MDARRTHVASRLTPEKPRFYLQASAWQRVLVRGSASWCAGSTGLQGISGPAIQAALCVRSCPGWEESVFNLECTCACYPVLDLDAGYTNFPQNGRALQKKSVLRFTGKTVAFEQPLVSTAPARQSVDEAD